MFKFNDGDIDNINGEITNVYEVTVPIINVSTDGYFCNISFTAQQVFGISELDLEGVIIPDANGTPAPVIVNDGEVIVADEFTLTVNIVGSGHVDLDPPIGPYLNSTLVELTAVADSCWVFDHWSGDLSGDTNPEAIIMDSNKTVTAHFSEIMYTLTVNVDGIGTVVPAEGMHTYACGSVVGIEAFADTGWAFDHWSGDLSGDTNPETIIMDSNKTVNATFIDITPPEITDVTLIPSDPFER